MNQAVQGDGTKREPVTVADWESELSAFGSLFADFERDGDDQGHQTWSRMHDARLALAKRIVALATGANPVAETGALEPERLELEAFREEAGHWEEVNGDLVALLNAKIERAVRSSGPTDAWTALFSIAEVKELRRGLLAACPDSMRGRRAQQDDSGSGR